MIIKTQSGRIINSRNVITIGLDEENPTQILATPIQSYLIASNCLEYILGEYESPDRAQEVIDEMFDCHRSRFKMPDK